MNPTMILVHFLPSLGFLLALVLLAHVLRQRRSPSSTMAWLLAIILIPYAGVPLYLVFGGRKMTRMAASKKMLNATARPLLEAGAAGAMSDPATYEPSRDMAEVFSGGFPVTAGNRISLLTTGTEAFTETLDLIGSATRTLQVSTFILGKDATGRAVVEALARKAAEGVRVQLLLDALGSMPIKREFLQPLLTAGGRAAFFMPMLHLPFRGRANLRNHRKMVLADGATAIMGGMNLACEYMGDGCVPACWQDLSMRIQGPAVAQAARIFQSDWHFAAGEEPAGDQSHGSSENPASGTLVQLMASGPDVEGDALRDALIAALFRAKRRVWIVTPYFIPDDLLLKALCMAAERSIDLRLIIPARSNHVLADLAREGYLTQMQEAGAEVLLYQPRMLHAKALLIDDSVAVAGSANMDMRSLLLNYEAAVCIYSADVIAGLDGWMRTLLADCVPHRSHRRAGGDILEGIGRLFAPLL